MVKKDIKKRSAESTADILSKQSKISFKESDSEIESDEEGKELESFLFGDFSKQILVKEGEKVILYDDYVEDKEEETELLSFEISTKPNTDFHCEHPKSEDEEVLPSVGSKKKKKNPVWMDPDDNEVNIDILSNKPLSKLRVAENEKIVSGTTFQQRLKSNFEKVLPAPAWADINCIENENESDEDEENKIFQTRKKLLSKPDHLLKGVISINKLKDLNKLQPSNSTITSLKFHPSAKIAFTASLNKNLNIYQVDGQQNEKLQNIFLSNFPIYSADFTTQGDKVILTSRRKFYYVYDLIEGSVVKIPEIKGRKEKSLEKFVLSPDGELIAFLGESGYINLVSIKTSQWVSSLKMNGKVNTAVFSPDSSKLYSAGCDGEVYIWDIKSRRCMHRFIDNGSLRSTSIGVAGNGKYIALGSSSGVINVYDDKCFVERFPSPLKAILNLTTSIDGTVFNSSSEILASYSPQVRNALKLVHFPSLTTFSNWPIEKQTLGHISCVDFSPNSGYLGIGNENGRALLFRLNHYPES